MRGEVRSKTKCFHCGDVCDQEVVVFQEKNFCCQGCKSVFELLQSCNLDDYYQYADNPGIKTLKASSHEKFAYLDNEDIVNRLVSFASPEIVKVKFRLPSMHCASCIWLIENFRKLVPGVIESRVNFVKLEASFSYHPNELTLRQLVEQLAAIGYEPELNLEDVKDRKRKTSKTLIYQIGVAGFCFGNIMLLSFPEYLSGIKEVSSGYRLFFGLLNFTLVLPVLLFSAKDYLLSALRVIRRGQINMDVPISLGILALFTRSTYEIFVLGGGGYMDSLAALIFFLLIGKWIQQRTYQNLSFERDYRSYFPIAVQQKTKSGESPVAIENIDAGDELVIRSGELIPVDAILKGGDAQIDYSFVTGESVPVQASIGERLYAGGRQRSGRITIEALKKVDQSYLTSLWNDRNSKNEENELVSFADKVGKKFTWVVISIAVVSGIYWAVVDQSLMLNAISAVLIVACPCALALSFPFAFGNAVRLMGRNGFYLKNSQALTKMAEITQIVFDKTGTLTRKGKTKIEWVGGDLNEFEKRGIVLLSKESAHPLSRYISEFFTDYSCEGEPHTLNHFQEFVGKGISAQIHGVEIKLGSARFTEAFTSNSSALSSKVYFHNGDSVKGYFLIDKNYQPGLKELIGSLKRSFKLFLISGDGEADKAMMEEIFDQEHGIYFNKLPHEKEELINELKTSGKTAMVGDGLNDAGALMASDFGISVADDIFRFTPASDSILSSESFKNIESFFSYSKATLRVVRWSFVFSFLYNGIGLFFAVQGILTPVIAAILMPLSSITVVLFVTIGTQLTYSKIFDKHAIEKTDKSQF